MKIALPIDSEQGLGGGFSFRRNLIKGLTAIGQTIVDNPLEADVALLAGVSMVTKETVQQIKEKGVKLIVRLDNVPRNSRNRNTGTSRLQSYCEKADEVVWQSEWARDYLIDFIRKEGKIIYNGTDLDTFKPEGAKIDFGDRENVYLYSRFNRDETKNWEKAWYEFQMLYRNNKETKLVIVGRFSPEQLQYNFDFFRGEKFQYIGIVEDSEQMARIYRGVGCLMATYYNDAFSNTYLEALCSGVKLHNPDLSGGTVEMLDEFATRGREYFSLERMAKDYLKVFEEVLNK